jgi:hypothetical protein
MAPLGGPDLEFPGRDATVACRLGAEMEIELSEQVHVSIFLGHFSPPAFSVSVKAAVAEGGALRLSKAAERAWGGA